ncbi:hypothetical protein [Neobacillus notoginsengisoli]|uniref:hypothetical protein n=1 Tax=Neobacillus notoginsengisoli TaxID=1578198 RepID=UPI001313ED75|nr:hypothetical protein [Neobacillus notoginsengisoli]
MENVKLIRNLRTSERNGNPRIFLEPAVLEVGGFIVGEPISYTRTQQALVIKKADDSDYKVAKRKRPSWNKYRPLIDYSNGDLAMLFRAKEKIDILVGESVIVIKRSLSFDLCVIVGDYSAQMNWPNSLMYQRPFPFRNLFLRINGRD